YAILPLLPIVMAVVFSRYLQLFDPAIELNTTTAMLVSLFIAMIFEWIRTKALAQLFNNLQAFWQGMGDVFSSVVTLIVAAEFFSKGLINLGLIDALVDGATHLNMSGYFIGVLITVIIFMAALLM